MWDIVESWSTPNTYRVLLTLERPKIPSRGEKLPFRGRNLRQVTAGGGRSPASTDRVGVLLHTFIHIAIKCSIAASSLGWPSARRPYTQPDTLENEPSPCTGRGAMDAYECNSTTGYNTLCIRFYISAADQWQKHLWSQTNKVIKHLIVVAVETFI